MSVYIPIGIENKVITRALRRAHARPLRVLLPLDCVEDWNKLSPPLTILHIYKLEAASLRVKPQKISIDILYQPRPDITPDNLEK